MKKYLTDPKVSAEFTKGVILEVLDEDNVSNYSFELTELTKEKIKFVNFNECKFVKMAFLSVELSNVSFVDTIFEGCDFSNSSFELCSFIRCQFKNCKLVGADIYDSTLKDVKFNGILDYINFASNKFKNVLFVECSIAESRFLENTFLNVYFEQSNMKNIEFYKTSLNKVDLTTDIIDGLNASLTDVKGLIISSYQAYILAGLLGVVIER